MRALTGERVHSMSLKELEAKLQNTSSHFLLQSLHVSTALILSVLVTHLIQVYLQIGTFSYIFCLISLGSAFFYYIRTWGFVKLMVLNALLILGALALQNYSGVGL